MYWLDQEIILFWGTLMVQAQISEFEDYCYKVIENGGSLSADDLSKKWLQLQRKYYGDNVMVPDHAGIDWARIPHLYYNYYVYKYATSITYAASLAATDSDYGVLTYPDAKSEIIRAVVPEGDLSVGPIHYPERNGERD